MLFFSLMGYFLLFGTVCFYYMYKHESIFLNLSKHKNKNVRTLFGILSFCVTISIPLLPIFLFDVTFHKFFAVEQIQSIKFSSWDVIVTSILSYLVAVVSAVFCKVKLAKTKAK